MAKIAFSLHPITNAIRRAENKLRAIRQAKRAGAIDAGRQCQRGLRACGFVDRPLQDFRLVVRAAGTETVLRGVAALSGDRLCSDGRRRNRERARACGSDPDEMAATDIHDGSNPGRWARVCHWIGSKKNADTGVTGLGAKRIVGG